MMSSVGFPGMLFAIVFLILVIMLIRRLLKR